MTNIGFEKPPTQREPDASVAEGEGFVVHDPMRSFFDSFPNEDAMTEVLTDGSEKQQEVLKASSGSSLLVHLLEELDYLPQIPTITKKEDYKGEEDLETVQRRDYERQKTVLLLRKPVKDLIEKTTEEYHETYWEDYSTGKGFNIDKIAALHSLTDEYVGESDIHAILSELQTRNPHNTRFIDADRILRMLLQKERGPEPTP